MIKNLILDFDDFHWKKPQNCIETIKKLHKLRPNIKLSFFVSPNYENHLLTLDKDWCKEVKNLVESDVIRIGIHGWNHSQLEFENITKLEAMIKLDLAEKELEKAEIPFVKVFKGPHWGINYIAAETLSERGYTHIYSHPDKSSIQTRLESENKNSTLKFVYYNVNLKDTIDNINNYDGINAVAHGHSWDVCENGIKESIVKIIKLHDYSENHLFINQ